MEFHYITVHTLHIACLTALIAECIHLNMFVFLSNKCVESTGKCGHVLPRSFSLEGPILMIYAPLEALPELKVIKEWTDSDNLSGFDLVSPFRKTPQPLWSSICSGGESFRMTD